jgi:hypothetical protein
MAFFLPLAPLLPFTEQLVWHTVILRGSDGTQQRISLRKVPRQIIQYSYLCPDDGAVALVDNLLHGGRSSLWSIPLWGERLAHGPALTAGATAIPGDTRYADWRDSGGGNYALIWRSAAQYEVVTVSAVAATSLTISALGSSYGGPQFIVPCRTGYLRGPVLRRRWSSGAAVVDLTYEVIDNQYVGGHAAVQSYENTEVLTLPPVFPGGQVEEGFDPDAHEIDSVTGRRVLRGVTDFGIGTQSLEWMQRTRATCWSFRQWLHHLNGAQKSFFLPTFRDDLTLAAPCATTDTIIDVVHRSYTDGLGDNLLRDYVAFRPGGGDLIVRRVTGMAELSATQERITLDAAPGVAFPIATGLCWVDRCRLAHDVVPLRWQRPEQQRVSLTLERVPNFPSLFGAGIFGMGGLAG